MVSGAVHQPWHRDFPMPDVTRERRRLNSLAVPRRPRLRGVSVICRQVTVPHRLVIRESADA